MPQYVNSSTVGVDLNNASDTATHGLGTKVLGSQDTMWVYVEANGALSTGDCVTMTTGFTATRALTAAALTAANAQIAFPQTSATSGQFVWAAQHGNNMYIRVSGTTSLSGVLYVAVSSGALHTTSASSTLAGVAMIANTSATAVVQAVLANLTWPRFINAGQ
jgi:hypothetical protein